MALLGSLGGLGSTILDMGRAGTGIPMGMSVRATAATMASPYLTGRELEDVAARPAYMFDPAYSQVRGENVLGTISRAPGALWSTGIKAGVMFGTLPRIAQGIATGASPAGKLMPLGLRTLMYGAKSKLGAGIWGFAAATAVTGSPLGGLFLGGLFKGLARGKVFGTRLGAGGGGLLGVLSETKYGQTVEKHLKSFFKPEEFTARIKRTRTKTITDRWYRGMHPDAQRAAMQSTYVDQFGYQDYYSSDPISKQRTVGGKPSYRRFRKNFEWIQSDRVQEFERRLNEVMGTRNSKSIMTKGMTREQLDDIIDDFGIKRQRGRTWFDPAGIRMGRPGYTGPWGVREGWGGPTEKDIYAAGKGRKYDVRALRKLGVGYSIASSVQSRIMRDLTGGAAGRVSGIFGLSWIGYLGKISDPGRMTIMNSQVDLINDKIDNLDKSFRRTKFGGKGAGITASESLRETTKVPKDVLGKKYIRTPTGRIKVSGFEKRVVKETVQDVADAQGYKLSMGKMVGQAGMVHMVRFMRAMFIWGGVKRVGGSVISGTMNTARAVTAIARNVGRMEFGTGKTLETRMASTERSRAVMAMQNVGISARSYLGQEAKIMNMGT